MKKSKKSCTLLVSFLVMFLIISVEARKNRARKHHKKWNSTGEKSGNSLIPTPSPLPQPTHSTIFDVLEFGAKGDGVSDDSKAVMAAWNVACKVDGATLVIPSQNKFMIKPITLQGPCMPHLVFQVDGTLLGPPKVGSWPKSSLFQWINLKWLQNFTIQGNGTFDGQASNWWSSSQIQHIQKQNNHIPDMKPTALRFYASYNVTVRDIKIINSPLCHLKFDNSRGIKIDNITIFAPAYSPNTDGIHLQNTQDVEIQHSNIGCGDDCISIQTGCSNIHIHHINCGPGHGISLGGLGKDRSVACVSNIKVENILLENTRYGARIKTWQGGMGSVKNVSFSNIQVSNVVVPIMIDQYYCDNKNSCNNQIGAVAISGIKFNQIIGTYSLQPIHLACSTQVPCTDIDLIDIQLKPSLKNRGFRQALCSNSYGKSWAPLVPSSMDYCLRRGSGSIKRISRSHENICKG